MSANNTMQYKLVPYNSTDEPKRTPGTYTLAPFVLFRGSLWIQWVHRAGQIYCLALFVLRCMAWMPTLAFRRARGDMIETYKIIHQIYYSDCSNLFRMKDSISPAYETRGHSRKIFHERQRLSLRKHCFTNRVVALWNSLPAKIAEATSLNSFKKEFDSYFINSPLYYHFDHPLIN